MLTNKVHHKTRYNHNNKDLDVKYVLDNWNTSAHFVDV